jgi:NAD(P)-dependent dehydrogenase (short-subunit alcohol dehydrogenase family)
MDIALTGGTGFIGSHILADLVTHDHDVVALVRDENEAAVVRSHGAAAREGGVGMAHLRLEPARPFLRPHWGLDDRLGRRRVGWCGRPIRRLRMNRRREALALPLKDSVERAIQPEPGRRSDVFNPRRVDLQGASRPRQGPC